MSSNHKGHCQSASKILGHCFQLISGTRVFAAKGTWSCFSCREVSPSPENCSCNTEAKTDCDQVLKVATLTAAIIAQPTWYATMYIVQSIAIAISTGDTVRCLWRADEIDSFATFTMVYTSWAMIDHCPGIYHDRGPASRIPMSGMFLIFICM